MAINKGHRRVHKIAARGFEYLEKKGHTWGMQAKHHEIRPHTQPAQGRPRGDHTQVDYEAINRRYAPGEPTEQGGWPLDGNHPDIRRLAAAAELGVAANRLSFGTSYAGEESLIVRPEQPNNMIPYA